MPYRAAVRRTTRSVTDWRVARLRIGSGEIMRHRLVLVIAGVVCLSPVLGGSLLAQAPAAAPTGQKPAAPTGQKPQVPRGQSTAINRREPPADKPAPRS